MSNSEKTTNDTYDLFMGTVDVINQALKEHSDGRVFGSVVSLTEKLSSGKQFGVAVYKKDADQPHDYFTVRFNRGKVELAARGKESPDIAWKVSQDYLKQVCEEPQTYIDNPARLDVDWLVSRVQAS